MYISSLFSTRKSIKDSGAQVVVCGGKISDLGLDYANQFGLMVVRLTSKWDMRRLAKSIGATVLPRLAPPTPDEMGFCDNVKVSVKYKKIDLSQHLVNLSQD